PHPPLPLLPRAPVLLAKHCSPEPAAPIDDLDGLRGSRQARRAGVLGARKSTTKGWQKWRDLGRSMRDTQNAR
ncbi:MAG: hypothetical protein ACRDRP_26100, partial [Pseudonocardiaceae bacterium]